MFTIGRFQYTPPWKLTRYGFIRPRFRCSDEHHNLSYYVVIPLVGMFVWFLTNNRDEHCNGGYTASDGTLHLFGPIVPDCPICDEMTCWSIGHGPIVTEPWE